MKPQILFSLVILFCFFITFSCCKTGVANVSQFVIKNGIVAGNINTGNYKEEVVIQSSTTTFQTSDRSGNVLKTCSNAENASDWSSILANIDFAAFQKLPAIDCQGCPALGDIGYEYLEIDDGKTCYKVQFGNGAHVPEVSNLLKIVRSQRTNFQNTCK